MALSAVVWAMIGIACWHFAVLVPDRFWGGIIGAFLAALSGALISGLLLPQPGIPAANPPGIRRTADEIHSLQEGTRAWEGFGR